MLICVPDVLSKAEVADFRAAMDAADWEDGRSTAGAQSAKVKKNEQLPPNSDIARQLGEAVIRALVANPLFVSAVLVQRVGRDDPELVKLTGIYHNLIRCWAEV